MPTAANITLPETLELLDASFSAVAKAISEGGCGWGRNKVIGLDGILAKLIEFLRQGIAGADAASYQATFDKVIGLANVFEDDHVIAA